MLARLEKQPGAKLADAHIDLADEARENLRGRKRDITTNTGVVSLLSDAINAFLLDPDGTIISRQELNTLGYVSGIQLKAIAAQASEEKPGDTIADLLGNGLNMEIRFTKEERKMFLTAGSVDKMANVLQAVKNDGRIIDCIQQSDGSFAVSKPLSEPPRMDAPIPHSLLASAFGESEYDISKKEIQALFGPSLGSEPSGEIELFGFDEVYEIAPKNEPQLGHAWESVSIDNPNLPGVLIRRNRCTKCGITTNNTNKHHNEECKELG